MYWSVNQCGLRHQDHQQEKDQSKSWIFRCLPIISSFHSTQICNFPCEHLTVNQQWNSVELSQNYNPQTPPGRSLKGPPRRQPPGRKPSASSNPLDKIHMEIAILKKCEHDNIVNMVEVIDDTQSPEQNIYLVFELMSKGQVSLELESFYFNFLIICYLKWSFKQSSGKH